MDGFPAYSFNEHLNINSTTPFQFLNKKRMTEVLKKIEKFLTAYVIFRIRFLSF